MTSATLSPPPPPLEAFVEFLRALEETVSPYDHIVPVLRGSMLMRHWFGDAARPAADIDLEWFQLPTWGERYSDPLEHARALCMHAVGNHGYTPQGQTPPPILFDEDIPVPDDGVNLALWSYATPGVRCYTGYRWDARQLTGHVQIDIAQAGAYDLAAIAPEIVRFPRAWGEPAAIAAYTQEMLLAAKLSWIVRSVKPEASPAKNFLFFTGEPKDLFDAHLLLTKGDLRHDVFQNAFLAVAMEDKFDWNQVELLLDEGLTLAVDPALKNSDKWQNSRLEPFDLLEKLRALLSELNPRLQDTRQHLPFLRAIQADPINQANLLIYADWLDERGDSRAEFLRLYSLYVFEDETGYREPLADSLATQPGGWIYHVLGGPDRNRDLRKRLEK